MRRVESDKSTFCVIKWVTIAIEGVSGADERTGGRAVECTGLENRQGCKPFVGSNPTLSATKCSPEKEGILCVRGEAKNAWFGVEAAKQRRRPER